MSGALGALRRSLTQAPKHARSIKTGQPVKGGGHDEPHYIHAEHMYETWNIKNKKLKWGVAISTFVCTAFGIPVYAVHFSNAKMAG
ncbi:g3156 [Coccomyxa viridis]|uniref:G3156 protein n=1 Tax=Coccomyxa viridis TaxID=1274662 RepID=A0ABP1FNQ7_9CHLO